MGRTLSAIPSGHKHTVHHGVGMAMGFELDHLFVFTSRGAPEADVLIALGLSEGSPNRHQGQGTANRRFFFHNVMLELVWIENESEARGPAVSSLHLCERSQYRATGASPFGVCLRAVDGEGGDPFPGWKYHPAYLPEGLRIHISENAQRIDEPLLFSIPWLLRPDQRPRSREPLEHELGVAEITSAVLTLTGAAKSSAPLECVVRARIVTIRFGREPLMELEFDRASSGRGVDLRPSIPLILRW